MTYVLLFVTVAILSATTGVRTQEILSFGMNVNKSRCQSPWQAIMEGEMLHFTSVLNATGVNLTVFWRYILFSEGDSVHDMAYYIGFIILAKCDGKKGTDRPDRGMVAGACWLDGGLIKTFLEITASVKYNASKVYMLWCGPGLYLKSFRIAFPIVLEKEYMTLTVNGQTVNLRENALPLTPDKPNYVVLCVINMAQPNIRASFNGLVFQSYTDCLMHSLTVTTSGLGKLYHVNVVETGSMCQRTITSILAVQAAQNHDERQSMNFACRTIGSKFKGLVWIIVFVGIEFWKSK